MSLTAGLLTLCCALSAGVLSWRLRLTGGPLLWSLLAAAAVTLTLSLEPLPGGVATAGQLLLGAMVGVELARANLGELRAYMLPLAAGLVSLVAVSLAGGFLLAAMTPLSLTGALLATMPGGATDAVVFANTAGAEGASVAAAHLTRQVLVIVVAASLLRRILSP